MNRSLIPTSSTDHTDYMAFLKNIGSTSSPERQIALNDCHRSPLQCLHQHKPRANVYIDAHQCSGPQLAKHSIPTEEKENLPAGVPSDFTLPVRKKSLATTYATPQKRGGRRKVNPSNANNEAAASNADSVLFRHFSRGHTTADLKDVTTTLSSLGLTDAHLSSLFSSVGAKDGQINISQFRQIMQEKADGPLLAAFQTPPKCTSEKSVDAAPSSCPSPSLRLRPPAHCSPATSHTSFLHHHENSSEVGHPEPIVPGHRRAKGFLNPTRRCFDLISNRAAAGSPPKRKNGLHISQHGISHESAQWPSPAKPRPDRPLGSPRSQPKFEEMVRQRFLQKSTTAQAWRSVTSACSSPSGRTKGSIPFSEAAKALSSLCNQRITESEISSLMPQTSAALTYKDFNRLLTDSLHTQSPTKPPSQARRASPFRTYSTEPPYALDVVP
eukprot:NODE_1456_length_1498_cov_20.196937_g1378_i0.p1 GENE.NODE_1456_length_1498_cov_20.196937_g1378_i0~~NODE_1456_length_1498_cov_20.196937_g1378_i0.p1  ORF type:complete len:441 (+),score=38.75 NODE_1456_length_1498_cov_20.196937_g1378_i0:53-1375(+)